LLDMITLSPPPILPLDGLSRHTSCHDL